VQQLSSVEKAWTDALFTGAGFYREQWPAQHFTTAPLVGPDVALAVAALARGCGLDTVIDVGAGGGELVGVLHRLDPALRLVAVELRGRPAGLPRQVSWRRRLPDRMEGLVIGHEFLDTVPCPVVELDPDAVPREVLVDPASGSERLGAVPRTADLRWLERWWPAVRGETDGHPAGLPGQRAEVGRTRDDAWADIVARLDHGLAVAVDYGHLRGTRPPAGSLRGYAHGRRVPVAYDGSVDITADVALDAVADRVGGTVHRQRDLLAADGPAGDRASPADRLRELTEESRRAEVRAAGGLGELGWVLTARGVVAPGPA